LGLSVVYGIILNHHGFVDVESSPGAGSTFVIHLPLNVAEAALAPEGFSEGGIPRGDGSILLVEDEASLRILLSSALEQAGYDVMSVGDGLEAINFLIRDARHLDVVFLDLNLPGFDGLEVYKQIRNRYPKLPVLILSGNIMPETRAELISLGQQHFLQKPYRLDDIGRTLQQLLKPKLVEPD
ncbi:MAG TPA: response regulator, partial [Opitutaceae bacterium]|nr:response regulator [Opitutaceae bacterium]